MNRSENHTQDTIVQASHVGFRFGVQANLEYIYSVSRYNYVTMGGGDDAKSPAFEMYIPSHSRR